MLEFTAESPQNAQFRRSSRLKDLLIKQSPRISFDDVSVVPFTLEKLFPALNIDIEEAEQYVLNSQELHKQLSGGGEALLGQETALPNKVNGNKYKDDKARTVDMRKVVSAGIDPSKVLVFRITQPSEAPKAELYWQTDIDAMVSMYELSAVQKNSSVILVSTLDQIASSNGGIVVDLMDNNGLSFRQVGVDSFPDDAVLASVKFRDLF